jgi:uncharacterized protein
MDGHDVAVPDAPERSRFEITVDGELAGFAAYTLRPGQVVFTHTEIDDDHQGRGLAGRLARAALDQVRARGLQVIPQCPYIAAYIRKHPEYVELVDAEHRERVP